MQVTCSEFLVFAARSMAILVLAGERANGERVYDIVGEVEPEQVVPGRWYANYVRALCAIIPSLGLMLHFSALAIFSERALWFSD
jgi:hypothetical protein